MTQTYDPEVAFQILVEAQALAFSALAVTIAQMGGPSGTEFLRTARAHLQSHAALSAGIPETAPALQAAHELLTSLEHAVLASRYQTD